MEHSAIDRSEARNSADDTYRQVVETAATALPGCGRENRAWGPRGQGQTSAAVATGVIAHIRRNRKRRQAIRRNPHVAGSAPRGQRPARVLSGKRNTDSTRTARRFRQSLLCEEPAFQQVILKTPVHPRRGHLLCQLPSGFRSERPRPRPPPTTRCRPQPIKSSHGKHVCFGKLARWKDQSRANGCCWCMGT